VLSSTAPIDAELTRLAAWLGLPQPGYSRADWVLSLRGRSASRIR